MVFWDDVAVASGRAEELVDGVGCFGAELGGGTGPLVPLRDALRLMCQALLVGEGSGHRPRDQRPLLS